MRTLKQSVSLLMILTTILLTSCSIPNEKEITANRVEISGFVNKYVNVVNGNYVFTHNGDDAFITIKFELKAKPQESICKENHYSELRLNAIGENGTIYDTGTYGFTASSSELKKVIDLINDGEVGDEKSVSFRWIYFGVSKDSAEPIFNNAKTFEIIDDKGLLFCSKVKKMEVAVNLNNTNKKSTISKETKLKENNWDKSLDDYEEYTVNYISLLEKISNGDNSVMEEYSKIMTNVMTLAEKMDKSSGDMSPSQMQRFIDIQTKYINASTNLK